MPMCLKKSSTIPRVGTLAGSVVILTGANHLHFAISLLCGRVSCDVSEEDVVQRVEAAKPEKVHWLVSDEHGFFFRFTQRSFMGRFAPTNSSARQRPS
jgi:hypothetical protein